MKTFVAVLLMACVAGAAAQRVNKKEAALPEFDSVVDFLTTGTEFNFTSLVGAAVAAGFADALGPDFVGTVFAPTDAAFEKVTKLAESLKLELTPELIAQVLSFHVINETVIAAGDLKKGENEAVTLFGDAMPLKVVREGKKVTLEDAAGQKIAVEKADIKAGEAIVHVIDNVAIPLALAAAEMPEGMAPMPEMVEAAKAAAGSVVASAAALAASVLAAALLA